MSIHDFGVWPHLAKFESLDGVAKNITWGVSAADTTPDAAILEAVADIPEGGTVLDLGCGLGRNLIGIAKDRPDVEVVGYDAAEMVARVPEYARVVCGGPLPQNAVVIPAPDWDEVKAGHYDVVIASLVFQHLTPAAIAAYVDDVKGMAETLVVYGRRANDHSQKTTWELLEECGLYPDNADDIDYSPRGDSEEHYLCIYRIK